MATEGDAKEFLRRDPITGVVCLIAPSRDGRPNARRPDPVINLQDDPFAPGAEEKTPSERLALRRQDSQTDAEGWLLRVVPNRYPVIASDVGCHDVVIEVPDGRSRWAQLSVVELARVFFAWQQRLVDLCRSDFKQVSVFHNEGFSAGATIPHTHSQIVAVGDSRYPGPGRLIHHDLVALAAAEQQAGVRVVEATEAWLSFCPFASQFTCQQRIMPHPESPGLPFEELSEQSLIELSARVLSALLRLDTVLDQPSLNVLLVRAGDTGRGWFLDILPRTGRLAGFELLTDARVLTMSPEEAASRLRRVPVTMTDDDAPSQISDPCDGHNKPATQGGSGRRGFEGQSAGDASCVTPPGYEWRHSSDRLI